MKNNKNKKRNKFINKQFYELLLYLNGGLFESVKTDRFTTFKGEYERMEAVANANSSFTLVVNLYDEFNHFEKAIQQNEIH